MLKNNIKMNLYFKYDEWKKKYTFREKYGDQKLICIEFSGFI